MPRWLVVLAVLGVALVNIDIVDAAAMHTERPRGVQELTDTASRVSSSSRRALGVRIGVGGTIPRHARSLLDQEDDADDHDDSSDDLPPTPTTPFLGLSTPSPAPTNTTQAPDHLPPDFDWQAYLHYNPDIDPTVVHHPQLAAAHYLGWGFRDQRVYKRLRLVLRYTACGGLMNQHYSHVAAVTLGTALGAHIILPHALHRISFKDYFNTDPRSNRAKWSPVPFDTLWDSTQIKLTWNAHGLELEVGAMDPHMQPNYVDPWNSYQTYPMPSLQPRQVIALTGIYLKALNLEELVKNITKLVVARASEVAVTEGQYVRQYPTLLLDLPCTLFCVASHRLPLSAQVARDFAFAPQIQALADKVVQGIAEAHQGVFNGLHLRIEQDAADWARILGGRKKLWRLYLKQCRRAGLSNVTTLYIATGLLTYKDQSQMKQVRARLKPYGGSLVYKELYLTPQDLEGLHPEQQALIDFLVLVRSRHFVGISVSTFSVFIREYRHLKSIAPRHTSFLVDCSMIGTEPLFNTAAVFP